MTTDLSPLIPVISAIALALLAIVSGVIIARTLKPSELMGENRLLRGEVSELRKEFYDFRDKTEIEQSVMGRGFDALWRAHERLRTHWGDPEMPKQDPTEVQDIEAARALRNRG